MKLGKYLSDQLYAILLYGASSAILLLMLFAFKSEPALIAGCILVSLIGFLLTLFIGYIRKKRFYDNVLQNLEQLDQKYLLVEMLHFPHFYEGQLLYQALYEANKSMTEYVRNYEYSINDFKEYVEMWIHEVKIPLSSLLLMIHNHPNQFDAKAIHQIKRLDNYVEQVLYYVRSENAENDYRIVETNLNKIIGSIALKNKDDLLENHIELTVSGADINVLTDAKWMEFILNQIFNNSIKYRKDIGEAAIYISTKEDVDTVTLSISDQGIGIPSADLPKIFEKSFTGYNGRIKSKSTGMGLYIAKKLCNKLGHQIEAYSQEGSYTELRIIFSKHDFYSVL